MQNILGRLGASSASPCALLGFLGIFFGWNGAASHNFVPVPYLISGAIAGLGVVAIGAATILVHN